MFLRNYYVNSTGKVDTHLITHEVKRAIREAGIANGTLTVLIPGATAGVTLLEGDSKIHEEYRKWVESQIPESEGTRPNRRSGTGRISSHLRAALVGLSLVLPVQEGRLMVGPWQEVVLYDFEDKPTRREITVQVVGDTGGNNS